VKHASEHEEESGTECCTTRSADKSGLDYGITKQCLHESTADTQARSDQQTEQRTGKAQFKKYSLFERCLRTSWEERFERAADFSK
jgi:hypothetical protein